MEYSTTMVREPCRGLMVLICLILPMVATSGGSGGSSNSDVIRDFGQFVRTVLLDKNDVGICIQNPLSVQYYTTYHTYLKYDVIIAHIIPSKYVNVLYH